MLILGGCEFLMSEVPLSPLIPQPWTLRTLKAPFCFSPYGRQYRRDIGGVPTLIDSGFGEVPRGEKMLHSGTDPESYITEYALVYEELDNGKVVRI